MLPVPAGRPDDRAVRIRLVAAGHRLDYAPDAIVEHRHPAGVATYAARKFRIGADKAALLRDMPGRWRGEILRFIAVNIACGGLFTAINTLATPHLGLLTATLVGVALVTPLGFILNRFIVFR